MRAGTKLLAGATAALLYAGCGAGEVPSVVKATPVTQTGELGGGNGQLQTDTCLMLGGMRRLLGEYRSSPLFVFGDEKSINAGINVDGAALQNAAGALFSSLQKQEDTFTLDAAHISALAAIATAEEAVETVDALIQTDITSAEFPERDQTATAMLDQARKTTDEALSDGCHSVISGDNFFHG